MHLQLERFLDVTLYLILAEIGFIRLNDFLTSVADRRVTAVIVKITEMSLWHAERREPNHSFVEISKLYTRFLLSISNSILSIFIFVLILSNLLLLTTVDNANFDVSIFISFTSTRESLAENFQISSHLWQAT